MCDKIRVICSNPVPPVKFHDYCCYGSVFKCLSIEIWQRDGNMVFFLAQNFSIIVLGEINYSFYAIWEYYYDS